MRIAMRPEDFSSALESAKREALNSFGDDNMLVEKYVEKPRSVSFNKIQFNSICCLDLQIRDLLILNLLFSCF